MPIQAFIDEKDIRNASRDKLGIATADLHRLSPVIAGLTLAGVSSAGGIYVATIRMSEAAAFNGVSLTSGNTLFLGLSSAVFLLTLVTSFLFYQGWRKRMELLNEGRTKEGVATGRFEIAFTDKYLVFKGPLTNRQIAWARFSRMEDTKTSILFRYPEGGFEFIPKNVLPKGATFQTIERRYKPEIEDKLSPDEGQLPSGLTLTYERMKSDLDEFRQHRRKVNFGRLALVAELFGSPPLVATGFFASLLVALAAFYEGLQTASLMFLATGAIAVAAAAVILLANLEFFTGAPLPLRRKKPWPFAQSDLTTVIMAKEGVVCRSRGIKQVFAWGAFDEFYQGAMNAYLVLSPAKAIALPKRAFTDDKHFQAMMDMANARIAAAIRAREEAKERRLKSSIAAREAEKQKQMAAAKKAAPAGAPRKAPPHAAAPRKAPPPQALKKKTQPYAANPAQKALPPAEKSLPAPPQARQAPQGKTMAVRHAKVAGKIIPQKRINGAAKPADKEAQNPAQGDSNGAKPIAQKSRQSAAGQSGGNPAAPAHKRTAPIPRDRYPRASGKAGR
jgi:hypothetical protein